MSKPEDKTFNTIRTISKKNATKNNGSIVSSGGLYVKKNIECEKEIVAKKLIIKELSKFACNVVIGGILYCPNLYTIDDDTIKFKRNIVPHKHIYPIKVDEKSSLGTLKEPWEEVYTQNIYAQNIYAQNISVECLKAKELEVCFIPKLAVGKNKCDNPIFNIDIDEININGNLNIVNPETNVIMMSSCNNSFETFVPNYSKWNSFQCTKIMYEPKNVYYINSSNIFIDTNKSKNLEIEFDTSKVPNNTKVKFYFINEDRLIKVLYKLIMIKNRKTFIFTSKISVKKVKVIFIDENIYLA